MSNQNSGGIGRLVAIIAAASIASFSLKGTPPSSYSKASSQSHEVKTQPTHTVSIYAPPPAPTKRLQDKWMSYGNWKFLRLEPSGLYRPDEIGKVIEQSCNNNECFEIIIERDAFDSRGNREPNYVSSWYRLRKK